VNNQILTRGPNRNLILAKAPADEHDYYTVIGGSSSAVLVEGEHHSSCLSGGSLCLSCCHSGEKLVNSSLLLFRKDGVSRLRALQKPHPHVLL